MWDRSRLLGLVLVATSSLGACAIEPSEEAPAPERIGTTSAALTVGEAVNAGCTTAQVAGLSQQIIGQSNCIAPGAYEELAPLPGNVSLGGAVLPYIQLPARDALLDALNANPTRNMQINSMLRTVAQQHLLYEWYLDGKCGIGLAATPGNSNHETGLAIDIQQYNAWKSDLESRGFDWLGANDPVHYDYRGNDAVNHKGVDVLAFQQLWNRNHPDDLITEDGIWGPQTRARMEQSPAEGFPLGPDCGDDPMDPPVQPPGDLELTARFLDATDVYDDGPSAGAVDLVEGGRYQLEVSLRKVGQSSGQAFEVEIKLPPGLGAASYELTRDGSGVETRVDGDRFADPAAAVSLSVDALAVGETARVLVEVDALAYTADQAEAAQIAIGAEGAGVEALAVDVYSQTRFTFDGGRLEGFTGDDLVVVDGALEVVRDATSPSLDLDWAAVSAIEIDASGRGTVKLGFDGEAPSVSVPLSDRIDAVAIDGAGARLTSIAFEGEMAVDALRVQTSSTPTDPMSLGAETAEGCNLAVGGGSPRVAWLVLGFALAGIACRRRR